MLVGNFAGATDPSQNGILGKPARTMSGYEIQPLYFSGNSGTGRNLGGTALAGNLATTTPARATASFNVASATLTSTAYLLIETFAAGNFNLTFAGSPPLAAPIALVGIVAGADANTTAANAKAAIDGNPTLASLFTTVVQVDTPAVGKARVAIIANSVGLMPNNVSITTTVPAGGDFQILDATLTAGVPATTGSPTGGTIQPPILTLGEFSFAATEALTGIAGFPALEDTTANQQAIATALATAISRIPQFAATAAGTVVSIEGPAGPDGGTYPYTVFQTGFAVLDTVTPANGYLAVGDPTIVGPILT